MKTKSPRIIFVTGLALAVVAAFAASDANAATGVSAIRFTPATTYTDGSPINSASVLGYAVDCLVTPTGGAAVACSPTIPNFAPNSTGGPATITYPAIGARVCFRLRTLLVGGNASFPSDPPACVDFEALRPNAPGNVTVTIQIQITP